MRGNDTAIHQGQSQFPPTAWSLLGRLRDPRDPRVRQYLDRMVETYWRPVYKFIRISWKRSNEDAKDLTQAFFIHLLEGDLLARADPDRGNFRKLLLSSLRNFLSNDARDGASLKRGGGRTLLSLDFRDDDGTGGVLEPADPQVAFDADWGRRLLERAVDRLQHRVKPNEFTAFRRFHLEDVPVKAIAAELRVTDSQVSHFLQDARAALRGIVTDEIRGYVSDESEIARELDLLFSGWR